MMQEFRLIALTPPGLADAAIAIAASRAGEIGVLDLEYLDDTACLSILSRLGRFARHHCGIKIGDSFDFLFHTKLPSQINIAILTPGDPDVLSQQVQLCRQLNLTTLLETTSIEEARLGEEHGVNGLVAKGHEASGRVGEETTFILLQRLLANTSLPVWTQGGIGLHTVAACYEAGAAGVLLDAQLSLTRESSLAEEVKASIARMDGSETICVGGSLGETYRMYYRPGLLPVERLRELGDRIGRGTASKSEMRAEWRREVKSRVGGKDPQRRVWLLGQDAAFAAALAKRFHTVGGVLEGMREAITAHGKSVRVQRPLDQNSRLARSHGTRYPIVQGPMTRVSDRASFAKQVAEAGGLPFLALALMRAAEVRTLLEETRQIIGDRKWGVGILGFVPFDLRQEQLEVIRESRPSFVLIAGGRPDQALSLEHAGIPTYLHVPSPGLLKLFVENGARRFVFEGRECGGHVGPRSSFVLWNTMIDTLLETLSLAELADCHILFAGGIHDATSASMVATMASPLAEAGAGIGVLLGTAYLFTREAVATGAIRAEFQQEAIRCNETALLETGPGHSTRCAKSPFVEMFQREKRRLSTSGKSPEEIREELERLNLGRLRIASKGVSRNPQFQQNAQVPKYIQLSTDEQLTQGMYMIGQVAALRKSSCTIAELHHEVSVGATERLADAHEPATVQSRATGAKQQPCDVAIIGMSCLLPKAPDLQTYWENILNKVDAITEIPKHRWDWQRYFDADAKARDKIYSKWGGFLDDIAFDPLRYGMPPNTLTSIEPMQLLTLEAVRAALTDAGYSDRPFAREHTSVILGVGGGISDLGQHYALRSGLPMVFDNVPADVLSRLPEWTEDSFAGILLNVAAGRVANRFDLGGVNYTVDAACASSLAAIYVATRELEAGTSDMVIVGGADTVQNPFGYLCFSKTNALSPNGRCRTFDEKADGIVISEGVAILVLKRLADAEQDGDRIYAVIKAVAGSSDGRDKGLTAPRPEGQALALRRAYDKAGFSPATVGLVEAHGTGTVAGDKAEIETLKTVFEGAGAGRQTCAVGSVKSMIGHTKCTAGVAGLLKIALALHHRVLPPTINVDHPNPTARFGESPFYVNTESRPWFQGSAEYPRRAGVSSFGFGGTNFHVVVEEYDDDFIARRGVCENWPTELLVWTADSAQDLLAAIASVENRLSRDPKPLLRDLGFTLSQQVQNEKKFRLAVIAKSLDDLRQKLTTTKEALNKGEPVHIVDPRGIYCSSQTPHRNEKIAFVFPGQGSQFAGMLRDVAIHFPEVSGQFELADKVLSGTFPERLSSYIYPPPWFSKEEHEARSRALTQTNVAQPALAAAGMGLFHLLQSFGVGPDLVAGHSFGEYIALCSAGVFSEETLYKLAEARGRCIIEAARDDLGTMAAVSEEAERISSLLQSVEGIWIANRNAARQTVISGTKASINQAIELLRGKGIQARPIPVACAFHSPLVAPAQERLAKILSNTQFAAPKREVYSNSTAASYPDDPGAIATLLANHLVMPVRFAEEIEAMYEAGARIFIEVGPNNVLTGLIKQIVGERPHVAVTTDGPDRSGLLHIQHTLGRIFCEGVSVNLNRLYSQRAAKKLDLNETTAQTERSSSSAIWMVNGGRVRPLREAAPAETIEKKETTISMINDQTETSAPVNSNPSTPASSFPATRVAGPSTPAVQTNEPSIQANVNRDVAISMPHDGSAGQVMLQFQQLMNQFLETQQQVMLAYLNGSSNGSAATLQPRASAIYSEPSTTTTRAQESGNGYAAQISAEQINSSPVSVSHSASDNGINAPVETASSDQPPGVLDPKELTRKLLEIVSERTGYPPEMLDLDLNMEADLGIDSIKRVEILGAFQRQCFQNDQRDTNHLMEHWTGIKTLRGIVDSVSGISKSKPEIQPPQSPVNAVTEHEAEIRSAQPVVAKIEDVPRFVVKLIKAPHHSSSIQVATDGVLVITDDEQGVAQSLAERLRDQGLSVVLVRGAEIDNPAAVVDLLDSIRQEHGKRIGGIIHLLPLKSSVAFDRMDFETWREHLNLEVKSLFYLAQAAAGDLKQASATGESYLVAAISSEDASPGHGGVTGFVKTLALEWPNVKCKVVGLGAGESSSSLAKRLLTEIVTGNDNVEVYYRGPDRFILQPSPSPLSDSTSLGLNSSSVVLLVGGARGITAEVGRELATRYKPTIVLVGRSPQPAEEAAETASLTSARDLKNALIKEMQRSGQEATPLRVETAYARLLQNREMRNNLAAMKDAGATVHYYQVDVRDEHAFESFIDELYSSFKRLDGVVYGAGIIEDKLVEEKHPESFDRVFDTKVSGAFVLSRKLRSESLKFLVFFSSVAGHFGNRGQSDYAAANEVLNKLAVYLDRRWTTRVVSLNWGPWEKTGMVSPEVRQQFLSRGVQIIQPDAGRRATRLEIERGNKGEVEVILGGGPWQRQETPYEPTNARSLPLLSNLTSSTNGNIVEITRTFDADRDRYLRDHKLDGLPVLPAAMAMELMAEVARYGWPDFEVTGVESLRVLRGIVFENGAKTLRVAAQPKTHVNTETPELSVDISISDASDQRACYRATVLLGERLPVASESLSTKVTGLGPFSMSVAEVYDRWLFHGPLFQRITSIDAIGKEGMTATFAPSAPALCLDHAKADDWLIDPLIIDSAFQLAIIWCRTYTDMTPLPARLERYRRFAPLRGPSIRCQLRARASNGGHNLETEIALFDSGERLLGLLEGMEFSCTKTLNRLAASQGHS